MQSDFETAGEGRIQRYGIPVGGRTTNPTDGRSSSSWGELVLRSRAKSQWIAVWWLLYHLQHPGRYLSRLQTDWLTHDVASVMRVLTQGSQPRRYLVVEAEKSSAIGIDYDWQRLRPLFWSRHPSREPSLRHRGSVVRSPCPAEILP